MLLEGQDPTSIVVESALFAVVRGHTAMNLIPPGVPHGALHYAVIHGSIRICQQLLQAKADPSLPDRSSCWPIRNCDICFCLNNWSAALLGGWRNAERPGWRYRLFHGSAWQSYRALPSSCWNCLAWIDVPQWHIEVIVEYGWAPALVCIVLLCKSKFLWSHDLFWRRGRPPPMVLLRFRRVLTSQEVLSHMPAPVQDFFQQLYVSSIRCIFNLWIILHISSHIWGPACI